MVGEGSGGCGLECVHAGSDSLLCPHQSTLLSWARELGGYAEEGRHLLSPGGHLLLGQELADLSLCP